MTVNKVRMTPAHLEDARYIAHNLRYADRQEVEASFKGSVYGGVMNSYLVSRDTCFIGLVNEEPVCLFGLKTPTKLSGQPAAPWLMGTDKVRQYARDFLRTSALVFAAWRGPYPYMVNYVDARNQVAIRWLKWLGFEVYSPEPYGPFDLPFCKFEVRG